MRLIDADEFYKTLVFGREDDLRDDYVNVLAIRLAILTAPEVKAIPIQWIRQWHGIDDIKDYDLREYVKCTILYMLKDWKNENDGREI